MASLQELLADDGFESHKTQKQAKSKASNRPDEPIALPIFICHDKKKILRSSSVSSSKRRSSLSNEPAIDEVAIRAVVSILSGYIGRYAKDRSFRDSLRGKCYSCLKTRASSNGGDSVVVNMELGIESIEGIIDNPGTKKETKMRSLRNSIRLLNILASLNSSNSRSSSSSSSLCGVHNSHISACAQLYLAIVYKMEKNHRISARHVLQVFIDAPFLARTHLLPELWEHFFLPHLLHIKIWYEKEVESVEFMDYFDREEKMKVLNQALNDQMDYGTVKFAVYYKEWLKVGFDVPPVPSVPSPDKLSSSRRSSNKLISPSNLNKSLYEAVFGSTQPKQKALERDSDELATETSPWDMEEEEKVCTHEEDYIASYDYSQQIKATEAKSCPETKKQDLYQLLMCQSDQIECLARTEDTIRPPNSLSRAIETISSSESLIDCENAMRVITKTWLHLHGNLTIEKTLSQARVIEGMLEVLFVSSSDEVLEMTISILAELVMRNDTNRHVIMCSDPHLAIFMRLLRSSSLFLKAGALLYLVKPESKQMISVEWVPLVLRLLEFADDWSQQTMFSVRCSPGEAGYYLMEQLLNGFDEDKNLENAKQVVAIGGLSLFAKRMDNGNTIEKARACSIIFSCVRADGTCRHFLANNLSKSSLVELLVREMQDGSQENALGLLVELICLNRKMQATKVLEGLLDGWGGLNTMHILFVYLQKVRFEERPMVAAVLLHLDLMGDPLKCSVYREEAVETIIQALDCRILLNEKVQEQSARALLVLGGWFSYGGEATTENWLLKEAGFDENSPNDSLQGKDIVVAGFNHSYEEDDAMQNWMRKTAIALLTTSGNKRLLAALADAMANAIPSLSRASLVTVSWITTHLHLTQDEDLQTQATSIFVPHLIKSLSHDRATEERVLASFTLLNLARTSSGFVYGIKDVDKKMIVDRVRELSEATWTANELISIVASKSSN